MSLLLRTRSVAAAVALLLPSAASAASWFDDFADGSALDGQPVAWTYNEIGLTPGNYDATTGDFILSAPGGTSDDNLIASVNLSLANSYVRTQARVQPGPGLGEVGGNVGLVARYNPGSLSGYAAILDDNQQFALLRLDFGTPTVLAGAPDVGVDAASDVLIELNIVGSQLDLYLWKPGTPKPTTPTASAIDATYAAGRAGILYNEDDDNTAGVFRFAAAQETPFVGAINGDFNLDGVVDGSDFLLWQRTFGSTTQLAADGNRSGAIDAGDLALWRSGFSSASPAPPLMAVPEPSALVLAAAGASLPVRRRRAR
jgi:hypothetical protein